MNNGKYGTVMLIWRFCKENATYDDIHTMEHFFDCKLPKAYAEIVLHHNGGRPRPGRFDTRLRQGARMKTMLPITRIHQGNIYEVYDWIKERLPGNMVPFASDESGNYLCFCYVSADCEPIIVLWNHEKANGYEWINHTLAGFLEGLH